VLLDSDSVEALVTGIREVLARPPAPLRVREFARRFGWETATAGQLAIFRKLAAEAGADPGQGRSGRRS